MQLTCPKCDYTGEPILTPAGPHTKASCAKCRAYIKFVTQSKGVNPSPQQILPLESESIFILTGKEDGITIVIDSFNSEAEAEDAKRSFDNGDTMTISKAML